MNDTGSEKEGEMTVSFFFSSFLHLYDGKRGKKNDDDDNEMF
jgi:hypothetical protein